MLSIPLAAPVPGYILAQPLPVADVELHCYITRRIRQHHAHGNRETISFIECLLADAEKNDDSALRTLVNEHEPYVTELINKVCDELERHQEEAPRVQSRTR